MKSTGSGALYNVKFARAVIDAFLHGKETFSFEHNRHIRYIVSKCITGVLEDIKNGYYSFKVSLA